MKIKKMDSTFTEKQDVQSSKEVKQSSSDVDKLTMEDSTDNFENIMQFPPPKLSGRYSFKGNSKSFTLGLQDDDKETQSLWEIQRQIQNFDFVSLFIGTDYIPCKCKHIGCSLCHDTKLLKVTEIKQQLNSKYQQYFLNNYEKLWSFISEKYGIVINTFEQWISLHIQMQYPSEQKKFLFQCNQCKIYYKDQIVLFQNGDMNYCELCKLKTINVEFIKLEYKSESNIFMTPFLCGESEQLTLNGPPTLKLV